ncbi:unnamed protein product [Paramecium primaurelia]|uniref:Transmembrane protein n=1 Tax=Paramecium primaurelia TaxID=5886 RepID=A0A8S1LUC6_PARPR|nr:unnamed protein product [Paramecium primaurelia]
MTQQFIINLQIYINKVYQTPNQTVTFYANFIIFSYQNNLQIDLTNNTMIPQSKNVSYPMNLILDRQVGYYNISQTQGVNQYCSLKQFFHNYSKIPNQSNYSLITSINNEFFAFQNNSYIQIVNSDLNNIYNLSYSNLNLSECLKSTLSNYTLYSICQDSYIARVETTQLPRMFLNISKISSVFNQIFVSGSLDQQQYEQLYWLNQSNNAFQPIFNSNYSCKDFSISQIVTTSSFIQQQQQIIILYIHYKEQIQQLYYLFLSVENNQITLQNSAFVKQYISNNENSRSQLPPSFFLIIQIFKNRAIILLTNFLRQIQQFIILKLSIQIILVRQLILDNNRVYYKQYLQELFQIMVIQIILVILFIRMEF